MGNCNMSCTRVTQEIKEFLGLPVKIANYFVEGSGTFLGYAVSISAFGAIAAYVCKVLGIGGSAGTQIATQAFISSSIVALTGTALLAVTTIVAFAIMIIEEKMRSPQNASQAFKR